MNKLEKYERPFFFKPNRIWRAATGGFLIDQLLGSAEPEDSHFSEEWIASTTVANNGKNQQSEYEGLSTTRMPDGTNGPLFRDILKEYPKKTLNQSVFSEEKGVGVLCKFLDSSVRLPIQCHPDIPFARKYYNSEHGKTESWFILATRQINGSNPYLLMGFKPGVDQHQLAKAVQTQNISQMKQMLHKIDVKPGDAYIIPGRFPHAIGPGILLLEIQEPTDWVVAPERKCGKFELPEELMWGPLEKDIALSCFDYNGADTKENIVARTKLLSRIISQSDEATYGSLIDEQVTDCFSVRHLSITDTYSFSPDLPWYIGIVVAGGGKILYMDQSYHLKQGDTFFVSYCLEPLTYQAINEPLTMYIVSK